MAKRYAIWDKVSPIITPIGEVLTAEQWKERHPAANIKNVKIVCAAGATNGAFFAILDSLVQSYEAQGVDFSHALTDEEKLNVIEAFEDSISSSSKIVPEELSAVSLASIAASLEYQNMLTLDNVVED